MLKDISVRSLKPTAKPQKLSDGGGLHLLVQPNGSKLWRLAYRFEGKQKTLALGVYPAVSLSDARTGRDGARKLLARSIDPSAKRKSDRRSGAGNSFQLVAEELIAKVEREGRAQVTLDKKRWLLAFAYPAFGDRPVGEVPVTYDDFQRYGMDRQAIAPAIREAEALGFIEVTEHGRAGNAEWRKPNLFRLTFRASKGVHGDGTHDWRKVSSDEEASVIAKRARLAKTRSPVGENLSVWDGLPTPKRAIR